MDNNGANNREPKRQRESQPDVHEIMVIARRLWLRNPFFQYSSQQEDRDFRETFGCNCMVVLAAWNLLSNNDLVPANAGIEQLLWTHIFMKSYNTRRDLSTLCGGADAGTITSHAFAFIDALASLEHILVRSTLAVVLISLLSSMSSQWLLCCRSAWQLRWENRFNGDRGADCLISVDGVDFRIPNHGPAFSSHKFKKKSGLRYEIALCIQTGDCVWVNGPYPCGGYPDITIFRDSLIYNLGDGERCEADDGYIGEAPRHIKCPKSFTNPAETEFMQQ